MNTQTTLKALVAAVLFSQFLGASPMAGAADNGTTSSLAESTTLTAPPATLTDDRLERTLPDAPRPAVEEFAMVSAEPIATSSKAISLTVPSAEALAAIYVPSTQPIPGIQNPLPGHVTRHTERMWWTLSIAEHSAATFDAWSTNHSVASGNHESNPLLKPFAGSAAIYGAIQAGPTALDFLGRKMEHSQNRMLRRMWWVPQVASTGMSIFAGAHNLSISR